MWVSYSELIKILLKIIIRKKIRQYHFKIINFDQMAYDISKIKKTQTIDKKITNSVSSYDFEVLSHI